MTRDSGLFSHEIAKTSPQFLFRLPPSPHHHPSPLCGFSGSDDGSIIHGFLWRNGRMHDLGVLPGDVFSFGAASNDTGEIVGASGNAHGERAVIWDKKKMTDLNTLIPSDFPIFLLEGDYINSKGPGIISLARAPITRPIKITRNQCIATSPLGLMLPQG
jgi:probable HAF family extracellular repeat protein